MTNNRTIGAILLILGAGLIASGLVVTTVQPLWIIGADGNADVISIDPDVAYPGDTVTITWGASVKSAGIDGDMFEGDYRFTFHHTNKFVNPYRTRHVNTSYSTYSDEFRINPNLVGGYETSIRVTGMCYAGDDTYSIGPGSHESLTILEPSYSVSTSISPSGSGKIEGGGNFNEEDSVSVRAVPSSGYKFDYWSGYLSGSDPSKTFSMPGRDVSITANFKEKEIKYTLSTGVNPSGSGSVSPFSGTYEGGKSVTLTASPSSGYEFDHWSGDASGTSNPVTVTMDSDKHVVANFVESRFTLDTSVVSGEGSIVPSSGVYDKGKIVTITANPAEGYEFQEWGGDASGVQNPTSVTMDSNKHVTATFAKVEPETVALYTNTDPIDGGSVTIVEEILPMGPAIFPVGTELTLRAEPNEGFAFDHWSGDASGTSPTISITMNAEKSVTAHFVGESEPTEYELTTEIAQGQGTISPSSGTYTEGSLVTLSATPSEGYQFKEWGGDTSGSENPKAITMNSDRHVEAYFKKIGPEQVTVTLKSSPLDSGSITLTQSKNVTVDKGSIVSLTAFPNSGYTFSHWSGGVSGTDKQVRFTVNRDMTAIANFEKVKSITDILKENISLIMMAMGGIIMLGGAVMIRKS